MIFFLFLSLSFLKLRTVYFFHVLAAQRSITMDGGDLTRSNKNTSKCYCFESFGNRIREGKARAMIKSEGYQNLLSYHSSSWERNLLEIETEVHPLARSKRRNETLTNNDVRTAGNFCFRYLFFFSGQRSFFWRHLFPSYFRRTEFCWLLIGLFSCCLLTWLEMSFEDDIEKGSGGYSNFPSGGNRFTSSVNPSVGGYQVRTS